MKVKYKGYEIEGSAKEIKELIGKALKAPKRKYTKRKGKHETHVTPGKHKDIEAVGRHKGKMSKAHKKAISRAVRRAWKNRKQISRR